MPRKPRGVITAICLLAAILGLGLWGAGKGPTAKQRVVIASTATTDQLGEPPIYGPEYVPPSPEERAQIKSAEDDPMEQFTQKYHRKPVVNEKGEQVGYFDVRDLFDRTARDAGLPLDVKDKDGNKIGELPVGQPYRAVAQ